MTGAAWGLAIFALLSLAAGGLVAVVVWAIVMAAS